MRENAGKIMYRSCRQQGRYKERHNDEREIRKLWKFQNILKARERWNHCATGKWTAEQPNEMDLKMSDISKNYKGYGKL